jgi:hypothetical protein
MDLDALPEAADIVSIHLKLSDESRGLLDEERLRRIGPRSVRVNTARGAIVDQDALVRALEEGALAAAGLDVFVGEPLPATARLRSLDNVVLVPHLGWIADLTLVGRLPWRWRDSLPCPGPPAAYLGYRLSPIRSTLPRDRLPACPPPLNGHDSRRPRPLHVAKGR